MSDIERDLLERRPRRIGVRRSCGFHWTPGPLLRADGGRHGPRENLLPVRPGLVDCFLETFNQRVPSLCECGIPAATPDL